VGGEDVAAVDTGKQAAIDGGREEAAVLFDEDVVDCAFGDFAAQIEKQHVVVACLRCSLEGLRIEGAVVDLW